MTSGDYQLSVNAVMEVALRKIAYKLNQSYGQFKDSVPKLCAEDMVECYTIAREAIGALETARRLIEARRAGIAFTPSSSQVTDAWKHAAEAIVDELADAQ